MITKRIEVAALIGMSYYICLGFQSGYISFIAETKQSPNLGIFAMKKPHGALTIIQANLNTIIARSCKIT